MAYTAFDPAKPDPATQGITAFGQSIRDNAKALRDAAIMGGGFYGWDCAISGGTAEQPTTFIYSEGTERVKAVITWGTVGGANGNPETVVYSYSSTSGVSYDTIATKTITYDASGNVTATAWT